MTINYQQPYYNQYQSPIGGYPYIYPQAPPPIYSEQSYIENLLRLNKGKIVIVYMSFEGSQWVSKIFRVEILYNIQNRVNYLLLTIYLSYITFDETIDYDLPLREKE